MAKRVLKLWGLWNYDTLFATEYTRRKCREFADGLVVGGKLEADQMSRKGSFRITKVSVREI